MAPTKNFNWSFERYPEKGGLEVKVNNLCLYVWII